MDWIRQEENQFITVPPEVAEKLSDKAKKVIGYSASPNLGWVKGRDKDNLLIEGELSSLSSKTELKRLEHRQEDDTE